MGFEVLRSTPGKPGRLVQLQQPHQIYGLLSVTIAHRFCDVVPFDLRILNLLRAEDSGSTPLGSKVFKLVQMLDRITSPVKREVVSSNLTPATNAGWTSGRSLK